MCSTIEPDGCAEVDVVADDATAGVMAEGLETGDTVDVVAAVEAGAALALAQGDVVTSAGSEPSIVRPEVETVPRPSCAAVRP